VERLRFSSYAAFAHVGERVLSRKPRAQIVKLGFGSASGDALDVPVAVEKQSHTGSRDQENEDGGDGDRCQRGGPFFSSRRHLDDSIPTPRLLYCVE